MSDGKIVFETAVDNSGAEKDLSDLKKDLSNIINDASDLAVKSSRQLQQTVSSACNKIASEAKELPSIMKEVAAESSEAAETAAAKSSDSATDAGSKIRKESERTKDSVTDDTKSMGDEHQEQAKKSESKWSAAFSKIKTGMQTCAKVGKAAFKAIGIAAAAVVTVATLGVNYNNQMESYITSFQTMLGSAQAAQSMVADLKDLASQTPLEMSDLASNAKTLLSFGISDKRITKYLKQIGDVAQGDSEKLSSLTLAFAQVQSAGKLTGQDLLQMINAGFNPLQVISEKTGKSMSVLKEEMSKGAISAEMVAEAFEIATSEGGRFFKAMEAQSKTFNGRLSTLKDNAMSFLGDLTAGLQNTLKDTLLPTVTGYLDELQEAYTKGGIEKLAEATGDVLASAVTEIANFTPKIIDIAVTVIDSFAKSIENHSDEVAKATVKIGKAIVRGITKIIPSVGKAAAKVFSAIVEELFGSKAGKAVKGMTDNVLKGIDSIFKTGKKAFSLLKPVVSNVLSIISNITDIAIPALNVALKLLELALIPVSWALDGLSWIVDKVTYGFSLVAGTFFQDITTKTEALNEELRESKERWEDLSVSAVESISSTDAETDKISNLRDRMRDLVDENGNLMGSKGELLAVIEELKSHGFDVEYDAVKDQIKGYQKLNEEITKAIELRRYESRLAALETLANEAEKENPQLAANYAAAIGEANSYIRDYLALYSGDYSTEVLSRIEEIIKSSATAEEALDTLYSMGGDYEKMAIDLDDYSGYLANYYEPMAVAQGFLEQHSKNTAVIDEYYDALALGAEGKYAEATQSMSDFFNSLNIISAEGTSYLSMNKDELLAELEGLDAGLKNALAVGNTDLAEDILQAIYAAKRVAAENGYEIPMELAKSLEENEKYVESAAENMADSCIEGFDNLENQAYAEGKNTGNGLANGIIASQKAAVSAALKTATAVITAFKSKAGFDSHSPSRKTIAIGGDVGTGIDVGLSSRLKTSSSIAYKHAASLVDKMRSAVASRRTALTESIIGNTTNSNTTNNYDERSFNQSFNFYSPNPTPSQTARAARLALEVT